MNELKKVNQNVTLKISSSNNRIESLESKLIKIEGDLNLVQAQEGFKALIDYFYYGLKFEKSESYKNKMIYKLEQSQSKNKIVANQIINLVKQILEKFYSRNLTAHKFDLSKSVIDQIVAFVNKNFFRESINKLKSTNSEYLLKELIMKRDEFFLDRSKLEKNEFEIYKQIPDLMTTLFN